MELASQSVSDLFLAKGDMSVALKHVAPAATALDHTVQDITAQIIGLGEGKLDLYVPSEAILEPISPAEFVPEDTAPAVLTYEPAEVRMTSHPVQSNYFIDPSMPTEITAVSCSVSDLNPSEAPEESAVKAAPACEVSSADPTSNLPGEREIPKEATSVRKLIPPKKDRMDPLKMDMSKPTVLPLTRKFISS